jgi:hypothetical protein
MKTIVYSIAMIFLSAMTTSDANAQAWQRNSKIIAVGLGLSDFFHLDDYYYKNFAPKRGFYNPMTGQINVQMEFGIHQYVGLGFTTGVGGRSGWGNGYSGEVNFPIGFICNFHFYQLIADRIAKNIHADELDIYAGLSVGSGLAYTYYDDASRRLVPLAFGGIHAGVRWFFAPRMGLNAEIGFGKSLVNFGMVFKL